MQAQQHLLFNLCRGTQPYHSQAMQKDQILT